MNNIKFDDHLQAWLDQDQKSFGCECICQNITIMSEKLKWGPLVESGTLLLVEQQIKLQGKKHIDKQFPSWLPNKPKVEVVTRVSPLVAVGKGYVVTRAYAVIAEKEQESDYDD